MVRNKNIGAAWSKSHASNKGHSNGFDIQDFVDLFVKGKPFGDFGKPPFGKHWIDHGKLGGLRFDLRDVDFIDADENGAETSRNVDAFLELALSKTDAGTLAAHLTVDGSVEKAFLVIWEYLDDGYVAEDYYSSVNENFVRLGVEYAKYLAEGGAPLTDAIGKFSPDDGDANDTPERLQSVHDNLLGNLTQEAIESRFDAGTEEATALIELVESVNPELLERPYYSGNEGADAAYDAVRAFDYDQGYARTDYIDTHFGALDDRATKDGLGVEMIFGAGNSADYYAVTRHEGAGVELALKAKLRGIGDYDESHVSYAEDGTATFTVEADPASADRMEWNIDWAATVTEAGDDDSFVFRMLADVDGSEGEDFIDLAVTGNEYSTAPSLQNSWNYGFFDDSVFDTTDAEGLYTVRLEAWDDGSLIASQTIYIEAV